MFFGAPVSHWPIDKTVARSLCGELLRPTYTNSHSGALRSLLSTQLDYSSSIQLARHLNLNTP